MEIRIKTVLNRSIAKRAGIRSGDFLLSVNGEDITDIFDYQYQISNEVILVRIRSGETGKEYDIEIEKEPDDDLGMEFDKELIDDEKSCQNKCIFCFIDQLPKGMRETCYFKDDDARLSFLTGNYVTLTNMSFKEVERVAKMKFSPVNISVHSTDPDIRCMMLNNRFAGDVLKKMAILKDAGIDMNCQIVLVKGINDKENLDRTLRDLKSMHPAVKSVSVVPVGITKYREGLFPLASFEKRDCIEVIDQVVNFQKYCKEEMGINFAYIADEIYIKAERDIPDHDEYDGFPQIENGVGLLSSFRQEICDHLEELKNGIRRSCPFGFSKKKKISIATGTLVYGYIRQFVESIQNVFKNITVNIYPIENDFFGRSVTVTGLIAGQDVITQLNNKDLGSELLLSKSMFKADEDVFLDGMTRKQMEEYLKVKVTPVMNNGHDFVESIIR
ncbi:MAG: DUF512 domain-containing protein [Clostridia bacterium]|jgi:putative radical SAM enzyme (TIGR03279 family)